MIILVGALFCFIYLWFDRLKQHSCDVNLVLTELFTITEKSAIFFLKNQIFEELQLENTSSNVGLLRDQEICRKYIRYFQVL